MGYLKLFIIGVVQGITELLPVSSSGHILIFGKLFTWDIPSSMLVLFHLGTTLAILIFFWKKIFKGFLTKKKWNFYLKILVATIPAALMGFFFNDFIEKELRAVWIIAASLIAWGVVMIVLERFKKKSKEDVKDIEKITWKQAIVTGLAQAIALIPGTSRSGITTIAGVLSGLDKYTALEFSFILSIPVLFGSFAWLVLKGGLNNLGIIETVTGLNSLPFSLGIMFLTTFVFGILSLFLLKKIQRKNWLTIFGIYRIVIGIALLIIFY